jgi:hypothetical protein
MYILPFKEEPLLPHTLVCEARLPFSSNAFVRVAPVRAALDCETNTSSFTGNAKSAMFEERLGCWGGVRELEQSAQPSA